MSAEHSHVHTQRRSRLLIVFAMNAVLIGGLFAVGVRSHSLGVLAAAAEYVADALAILVVIGAHRVDLREEQRLGHAADECEQTDGSHRHRVPITAVAALVNASLVSGVSAFVVIQAVRRIVHLDAHVDGLPAFVIAVTAMVVMGACALLLMGDDDLGVRSVLLDTAGDAAAAGGVALASAAIWLSGGHWQVLDPLAAIAVAVVVLWHAVNLAKQSARTVQSAKRFGRVVHSEHEHADHDG